MNDDVRDGLEHGFLFWGGVGELQRPLRDQTGELEGQVAFILEVQVEQTTVIDPGRERDLLVGAPILELGLVVQLDGVVDLSQRAVDVLIRAGDDRQGHADAFDPPQVEAVVVILERILLQFESD